MEMVGREEEQSKSYVIRVYRNNLTQFVLRREICLPSSGVKLLSEKISSPNFN